MSRLTSITVRGLLSFGWEPVTLELKPLNVLIGPNASGKSNLLDLMELLRSVPDDYNATVRARGGALEWIHKGSGGGEEPVGEVEAVVELEGVPLPLRYHLALREEEAQLRVDSERLETAVGHPREEPFQFLVRLGNHSRTKSFQTFVPQLEQQDALFGRYHWSRQETSALTTLLAKHRRFGAESPQLTALAEWLQQLRVYQQWSFGPESKARQFQPVNQLAERLNPDGSNLGLVLKRLQGHGETRERLVSYVRRAYPALRDFDVKLFEGALQVVAREEGFDIPASRLSDGTLRWLTLCLLLCDPKPPPLLCLDEPEMGLHPDLLRHLAELLQEAAQRTQLIVTTHSEELVSEFSGEPESVVVCSRDAGGTRFTRLEREPLRIWLEEYSLGKAWRAGEIGGNP